MKRESLRAARVLAAPALAILLGALGGCASVAKPNPRDPWEGFNRRSYEFNEGVDRIVLKPAATWYREKVPPLVRTGVSNFFGNLGDGWSAINSLLQFRLHDFSDNYARFQLNTSFGLLGIFDLASDLNIDRHREDFGQTLGRWGMPAGPYVVLPLLGPSTLRDAAVLPVEYRFDPVGYIKADSVRTFTQTLRVLDTRANLIRVSNVLEEVSLDKYSFTRDAYLQRRRADVMDYNGGEVPPPLPDESLEPSAGEAPAAPAAQPQPAPAR